MYFKLNLTDTAQVDNMNAAWLAEYKQLYPDTNTTAYALVQEIEGYGYIIKDVVTEQYITDYIEVCELPEIEIAINN